MGKKDKRKTKKAKPKVKSSVYLTPIHPLFTKSTKLKDIPLEMKRGGLVKKAKCINGIAIRGRTKLKRVKG
tara:strand:- start:507 stop:719 length:213 start_codon:yes stop_codon:yes gene_type:complete